MMELIADEFRRLLLRAGASYSIFEQWLEWIAGDWLVMKWWWIKSHPIHVGAVSFVVVLVILLAVNRSNRHA